MKRPAPKATPCTATLRDIVDGIATLLKSQASEVAHVGAVGGCLSFTIGNLSKALAGKVEAHLASIDLRVDNTTTVVQLKDDEDNPGRFVVFFRIFVRKPKPGD